MKLICEIEVPFDASDEKKLDAIKKAGSALANWKEVKSRNEMMKCTDLKGKCGSCKYFIPRPTLYSKCYGECAKGRKGYKQRTARACPLYEEKK